MDVEVMNQILGFCFGPDRHPDAPAELEVALFFGNPKDGGAELDADGSYSRVTLDQDTDWGTPSGGFIDAVVKQLPATTDAYSSTADYFALIDPVTGWMWHSARFAEPIDVTGAGNGPYVQAQVAWADAFVPDEG